MSDKLKIAKEDRETAREGLLKLFAAGEHRPVVYTVLRHVARSGMMRRIDLYVMEIDQRTGEARPRYISGWAAAVLGEKYWPNDGIRVNGCGMDMGFHLAYQLSRALYNATMEAHKADIAADSAGRKDAGYQLEQRWI